MCFCWVEYKTEFYLEIQFGVLQKMKLNTLGINLKTDELLESKQQYHTEWISKQLGT